MKYSVQKLMHLMSPIKYTHIIRIRVEEYTYELSRYERDGYACVVVHVESWGEYSNSFLLRLEDGHIWYGNFDVDVKKVFKEIEGIKYSADVPVPTEWIPVTKIDSKLEMDLVNIIKKLLEE